MHSCNPDSDMAGSKISLLVRSPNTCNEKIPFEYCESLNFQARRQAMLLIVLHSHLLKDSHLETCDTENRCDMQK